MKSHGDWMLSYKEREKKFSLNPWVKQFRPESITKSFFVFLPALFAAKLFEPLILLRNIEGAVLFFLMAAACYMFNDCIDLESDRKNPHRCTRPLAADQLSMSAVKRAGFVLAGCVFLVAGWIDFRIAAILAFYYGINLLYSSAAKKHPPLDIILLATGFVLRVECGAVLTGVVCSHWLFLITFTLALLLAVGKRKDKNQKGYDELTVRYYALFLCCAILVVYTIYVFEVDQTRPLNYRAAWITLFPVIIGLLRYLQLLLHRENSGDPLYLLYHDVGLQICCLVYGIMIFCIIFLKDIPLKKFWESLT